MTVTPEKIVSYYINLIDEEINQLGPHLADNVILYWYGRSVKGRDLVLSYLSEEIADPEHNITSARAIPEIHYREVSSVSKVCSTKPKEESCAPVTADCVGLLDSGGVALPSEEDFPGRKHKKSGFQHLDTSLVQNTPDLRMSERQMNELLNKPKKRKFIPNPSVSMLHRTGDMNFLEARGDISFRRVRRHGGVGRLWNRQCTLQLAYSCPPFGTDPISCCRFSVIIYTDQMKCRRNLTKAFEQMEVDQMNIDKLEQMNLDAGGLNG